MHPDSRLGDSASYFVPRGKTRIASTQTGAREYVPRSCLWLYAFRPRRVRSVRKDVSGRAGARRTAGLTQQAIRCLRRRDRQQRRCQQELTEPLGKLAMVTQQSFMFISSYEPLRAHVHNTAAVETMAHLGPKAFPSVTSEKVNTTAFVFQKQPEDRTRLEQVGIYFRIVKEPSAESKQHVFETALAAMRAGQENPLL